MTTPASAALSIRKSYCRPMPRPLSLTALPYDEPDGYGDEDDDGPPWDEEDDDGEEADK